MSVELTKEQKTAYSKICKFIDNTKKDAPRWMTIDGKAGVGKTTVLISILLKYCTKKNIIAGAIAHKAKQVLCDKFKASCRVPYPKVDFYSVASMLGMKLNEETGEFEYGYAESVPAEDADIILIDECSMISGEQMEFILSISNPRARIIFSGDIGQLPPIGKKNETIISPTFSTKNIVHLHTRMRQAEESPILPYSDYYWDSVTGDVDKVSTAPVENIVNDHGGIYFSDRADALSKYADVFKGAVERGDLDTVKYVCYRNVTRQYMNRMLRNHIFNNPTDEYLPGDFVIFMDNYSTDESNSFKRLDNSSEYIIESAELKRGTCGSIEISYWDINFVGVEYTVPVVAGVSKTDFDFYIKQSFAKAFSIKEKSERKEALKAVYRIKNSYANIDYSYAITSHKSQGSTYKCVIVDKSDIMNNNFVDRKTKYRSLYTAITRASKLCTIVV